MQYVRSETGRVQASLPKQHSVTRCMHASRMVHTQFQMPTGVKAGAEAATDMRQGHAWGPAAPDIQVDVQACASWPS